MTGVLHCLTCNTLLAWRGDQRAAVYEHCDDAGHTAENVTYRFREVPEFDAEMDTCAVCGEDDLLNAEKHAPCAMTAAELSEFMGLPS